MVACIVVAKKTNSVVYGNFGNTSTELIEQFSGPVIRNTVIRSQIYK